MGDLGGHHTTGSKWRQVSYAITYERESRSVMSTLCDPMNYTVHGILQARIQEWVAFPFSRGSSQPRDKTQISCITGKFFTLSQQSNVQNSPNQASAVREP